MKRSVLAFAASILLACGSTPIRAPGGAVGPDNGDGGAVTASDGGAVAASDGGAVAAADGGGEVRDAGPATPQGGIECGTSVCESATQDCCVSRAGRACQAKGSCQGATVSCSGPASCASGEVCCLTPGQTGAAATCEAACQGPRVCAGNGDCPAGEVCEMGRNLGICRTPAGGDGGFVPPPDGGRPRRDGGTAPVDAGPPPNTGLTCGRTSCDPTTQDCCIAGRSASCVSKGSCTGQALSCTNALACSAGEVCCATLGASFSISATCAASCGAGDGGGISVQACASDAECPNNEPCTRGPLGLGICGSFGPGGMGGG